MPCIYINTSRPRQMAAISQTIFSYAFFWTRMYEFRLRFLLSLFLMFKLTIFQHCFRYWLGADQATSPYLNQWWFVYWCIYGSLGLNELKHMLIVNWCRNIKRFVSASYFFVGYFLINFIRIRAPSANHTAKQPWRVLLIFIPQILMPLNDCSSDGLINAL